MTLLSGVGSPQLLQGCNNGRVRVVAGMLQQAL
jgi:hypothetical protein